jgi:hypothetical protein
MKRTIDGGLLVFFVVAALMLAGCDVARTVVGEPNPIPAGPVGPVVANPNGGPPVECRGIPIAECQQSAQNPGRQDVVRVIVTCTKVCTPLEGEYRLDYVTAAGRVEQAGGGAYASAPAAPGEPEPVPAPS